MGKIIPTKIDRFNGGIVNDPRLNGENICRMVTNFDIHTNTRLTPFRSSESGDSAPTTSQKQNFTIALRTGTTYSLYSLGVKSGASTAEVLYKDGLDGSTWATPSNNQSGSGGTNFELFTYYQRKNLIYGARAGTDIWAFSPSGSTWDDDIIDTDSGSGLTAPTYSKISNGLVHSKDILYIGYDNKIMSNDNGTWTIIALTLPAQYYITSLCEYNGYLAIACAPLSGSGNSKVFLWDTDSDSWNEEIVWGGGALKVLDVIDGYLVGVSFSGDIASRFNDVVTVRVLSGSRPLRIHEIVEDVGGKTKLLISKQVINNKLHFLMTTTIDGAEREGLWSVSRIGDRFVLAHDRTPNNDTALGNGVLKGFYINDDYTFISYTDTNGDFGLSKTNDQAVFATGTSIYESQIFNTEDSGKEKKLLSVTVTTAPLPEKGVVVLKYKINENISGSTWTTIFTHGATGADATDNSLSHTAVNIESSGANLPQYKEIMFRIESTGGAEITGLKFKEELMDNDLQ